jgi:hypothetical protein
MFIEEENIRYRKKKDSGVSKANKKSKHKHIYDKIVVFKHHEFDWLIGEYYCSICGKIGNTVYPLIWSLSKADWLKQYPDVIFIETTREKPWSDIDNINEVL